MQTNLHHADCLEWMRSQPDDCVDFVFTSPPYAEKGQRYEGNRRPWGTDNWVTWMTEVVAEAVRLSRGYSMFVVNGAVRNHQYLPACEGVVWEAHNRGITCDRPIIWHKNSPPNRRDYFANAWEYVLAFRPSVASIYFDWEAIATEPLYANGGDFRQRNSKGERRDGGSYPKNEKVRPRDVVRITVGGGHMGRDSNDEKFASQGEAPFPTKLVEHFVQACCPAGGVVLDPFVGSGTTAVVCAHLGRSCIGLDSGSEQIALARRRIAAYVESTTPAECGLAQKMLFSLDD